MEYYWKIFCIIIFFYLKFYYIFWYIVLLKFNIVDIVKLCDILFCDGFVLMLKEDGMWCINFVNEKYEIYCFVWYYKFYCSYCWD